MIIWHKIWYYLLSKRLKATPTKTKKALRVNWLNIWIIIRKVNQKLVLDLVQLQTPRNNYLSNPKIE